jgi:hypothetical protein
MKLVDAVEGIHGRAPPDRQAGHLLCWISMGGGLTCLYGWRIAHRPNGGARFVIARELRSGQPRLWKAYVRQVERCGCPAEANARAIGRRDAVGDLRRRHTHCWAAHCPGGVPSRSTAGQ